MNFKSYQVTDNQDLVIETDQGRATIRGHADSPKLGQLTFYDFIGKPRIIKPRGSYAHVFDSLKALVGTRFFEFDKAARWILYQADLVPAPLTYRNGQWSFRQNGLVGKRLIVEGPSSLEMAIDYDDVCLEDVQEDARRLVDILAKHFVAPA